MGNDLINPDQGFDKLFQLAERLSKSGIIPSSLRGKPNDIAVILMTGKEMNLPPMMSLQMINVVQGRPELSAQGKIAVIKRNFPNSVIKITSDSNGAKCEMARDRESELVSREFTRKDAEKAGFMSRDTYQKFPETMFIWRAVSQCARIVFPDALLGLYDAEEIRDISEPTPPKPKPQQLPPPKAPPVGQIPADIPAWEDDGSIEVPFAEELVKALGFTISFGSLKGKALRDIPIKDLKAFKDFLTNRPGFDRAKVSDLFDALDLVLENGSQEEMFPQ